MNDLGAVSLGLGFLRLGALCFGVKEFVREDLRLEKEKTLWSKTVTPR
jgi:hypothetical protein